VITGSTVANIIIINRGGSCATALPCLETDFSLRTIYLITGEHQLSRGCRCGAEHIASHDLNVVFFHPFQSERKGIKASETFYRCTIWAQGREQRVMETSMEIKIVGSFSKVLE